tara:strand:+ start:484 stop:795 length:312 start_codon:yes stop_codon:yes gene_type:complete
MKKIKTEKELSQILLDDPPMPPGVINTSGYGNLGFDCGCGKTHDVNDPNIKQIANYRPVKVLFKCNSHYTKVRIKGIFSQTCVPEATWPIKLTDSIVKKRKLK